MSLQHKLTTVVAPAGYGKTTLLREWVGSAEGEWHPVAWLLRLGQAADSNLSFPEQLVVRPGTLKISDISVRSPDNKPIARVRNVAFAAAAPLAR